MFVVPFTQFRMLIAGRLNADMALTCLVFVADKAPGPGGRRRNYPSWPRTQSGRGFAPSNRLPGVSSGCAQCLTEVLLVCVCSECPSE